MPTRSKSVPVCLFSIPLDLQKLGLFSVARKLKDFTFQMITPIYTMETRSYPIHVVPILMSLLS